MKFRYIVKITNFRTLEEGEIVYGPKALTLWQLIIFLLFELHKTSKEYGTHSSQCKIFPVLYHKNAKFEHWKDIYNDKSVTVIEEFNQIISNGI